MGAIPLETSMKYQTNPALAGELRHLRYVEGFLDILSLLVRFDEQTGRTQRHAELEAHFMRKAVTHAPAEDVTVLLGRLEEALYYVVVRVDTRGGLLRTSWLHEDEIILERKSAGPDHPVQGMLCMTDLFLSAEPIDLHRFQILDSGRELRESA